MPLTLSLLSSVAVAAGPVYKWVDAQGVTHYSDQPHPDAQTVEVPPVQTYHSTPAPNVSSSRPADTTAARYGTCRLARPENDEVFLNTSTVPVAMRLVPDLVPGDKITLTVDGKLAPNQPTAGGSVVLTNVDRGSHTVSASVTDAAGKQQCATPAITFHVRQPSVQAPVKAVRPKF